MIELHDVIKEDELKSRLAFERTWLESSAQQLTKGLGSLWFLTGTLLFVAVWLLINIGILGIEPFDPYPFGWLAIIMPTAAMVVSIIVLISQNRESHIAEIRQQIDFEINVRTEHEVTKVLNMMDTMQREIGIDRVDRELEQMKETTDIAEIKEVVEEGFKNTPADSKAS